MTGTAIKRKVRGKGRGNIWTAIKAPKDGGSDQIHQTGTAIEAIKQGIRLGERPGQPSKGKFEKDRDSHQKKNRTAIKGAGKTGISGHPSSLCL